MIYISPFGVICVLLGLPGALWPYKWALLQVRMNTVYSKTDPSTVEPADSLVSRTRPIGIALIVLGLLLIFLQA